MASWKTLVCLIYLCVVAV